MKPTDQKSTRTTGRLRTGVRWAVGATFLIAGALKLAHPGDFHSHLLAYDAGLPDLFLRWVVIAFPWLEVMGGGALLADFWPETMGVVVVAMSLLFVVMLGQAVLRGLDLNCGCFGRGASGWFNRPIAALARAVLLLAATVWILPRPSGGPPKG